MLRPKMSSARTNKKKPSKKGQMRTTTIRLPEEMFERLDRLLECVQPRMRVMGKEGGRADIIRAVMIRGIVETEKQFGVTEKSCCILIESRSQ